MLTGSTPELPGALCRGRWDLWDPLADGETRAAARPRHDQAVALCEQCPSLVSCRTWIRSEPRRLRQGVVAGHIYYPPTTAKEQADD
ncbi:hypothetical protein CH282_26160 [Rhodococcus sp. 06-418-1B]|nr:hypothetical protein CH282_26160 [Rhodococcus sp. 06-418-1B]